MKVRLLEIENFRGVKSGRISFLGDTLLVGGNNIGKSTVCEALDLVLGPERLFRRPVVDEHDFFCGAYTSEDETPVVITVRVVLTDLSDEVRRRFSNHLRRWNDATCAFLDAESGSADVADGEAAAWCLPLIFRARYNREEDDFEAGTFFDHPAPETDELSEEDQHSLAEGRSTFGRAQKRLCGFIYLRALRTGSRALGLQRGSLLDTILRLGGDGSAEMWADTLNRLRGLDPAVGDIEQLQAIRASLRERVGQFVTLADSDDSTAFFASELTREHLRDVVRLFVATEPSEHPVPFTRQGTGSVNLLVFALLTIIADLKGANSVIFAMEEPEIALPPHTQRRVTKHVLRKMGQTIVTSHSPYVIEQFEPEDVVMLHRRAAGELRGTPIDTAGVKPKTYRTERRQFAEAILSKAVIVVEGSTEASILPAASAVLEKFGPEGYMHLDLAGVSIYQADGDGDVPRFGPVFRSLGKLPFGMVDKQETPYGTDAQTNLGDYEEHWESPESGVERLLLAQTTVDLQRRFLASVATRPDYPSSKAPYSEGLSDEEIYDLAFKVLRARKGSAHGYAAMMIEHCESAADLPAFLRTALLAVDAKVRPVVEMQPDNDETALPDEAIAEGIAPA